MSTNVQQQHLGGLLQRIRPQRGLAFGLIIIGALFAFEIFNYSTTEFALYDLLGNLTFLGIRWATILAVAFCGIDFAGIARLFTPEEGENEASEVWYLFGAWLLAATMNAILTWWGVSIAILNHQALGNSVVARETLLRVVPIFVAVMVWLIRVLIIGTFSVAGARLFSQGEFQQNHGYRSLRPLMSRPSAASNLLRTNGLSAAPDSMPLRPSPKPVAQPNAVNNRPEPTYHPISMSARPNNSAGNGQSSLTPRQ